MSNSSCVMMEEGLPLKTVPGAGDAQNDNACVQVTTNTGPCTAASCCDDNNHRKLAVCSIICGISCIGVKALINSVKAEQTADRQKAAEFSRRAKKYGIISIVVWVAILAFTPMLMALISYLLTLQD